MKTCIKCKKIKPLSEFYKNWKSKDGHQSCCKSCAKAYEQSDKGKIALRKGNAKYNKTTKGKAVHRKANAKYYKTSKGKTDRRKGEVNYKARHPNRLKAKDAVHNAIVAGRLPRHDTLPCHYCPNPAQQYHHWHGYEPEHWLDVVPTCVECHRKEHVKWRCLSA